MGKWLIAAGCLMALSTFIWMIWDILFGKCRSEEVFGRQARNVTIAIVGGITLALLGGWVAQ